MHHQSDIRSLRDTLHQHLSGMLLDVEEAYENEREQQLDDGALAYRWALTQVYKVLRPHLADARRQLTEHRPLAALSTLLGIYEGVHNLRPPLDGGYDLFDDYEAEVMALFHRELETFSPDLAQSLIEVDKVGEAIDLIFASSQFYETDPRSRAFPMLYDWEQLEPLLLALVGNESTARYFLEQFDEEERLEEPAAFAVQHACQLTGNTELWLAVAREHAPDNARIARRWLDHLLVNDKDEAFREAARSLFSRHPEALSEYLLQHLDAGKEPVLYRRVLSWHARCHASAEHYRELRPLLSETEREAFIEEISRDWDPLFYATVLAEEDRLEPLLRIVKFQLHAREFPRYLQLLLPNRPAEALELVRNQIDQQLPREQGADFYRRLGRELALFLDLPAPWPGQARELAADLHRRFPLRPKLHEALTSHGFPPSSA